MTSTAEHVKRLLHAFGPTKPMGEAAIDESRPHYFLQRPFLGDQDLLIIFNTRRCRYHCDFCELPTKSTTRHIPTANIVAQFDYVVAELKHSLSVLNRVTLSNDGSVLDESTFERDALMEIADGVAQLKAVRRFVLESRLEFVDADFLLTLSKQVPKARIDILTGFETLDSGVRDTVLNKREPLSMFLQGLDQVRRSGASLTAYVLFKPSPFMTDKEAEGEASDSIDFLAAECESRHIDLTIRLNPTYCAEGSTWAERAASCQDYQPPRLTDVLALARRKRREGVPVYVGLSTEGLDARSGTYRAREDFSSALLKAVIAFNGSATGL
jgi:radical SAM enzyme (TIGR01210 family)